MRVPPAITALVAAAVIIFGVYRIVLSRRSDADDDKARRRGGLYAMPRRTHLLLGVIYVLLGLWLISEMLGLGPLRFTRGSGGGGGGGAGSSKGAAPKVPANTVPIDTGGR